MSLNFPKSGRCVRESFFTPRLTPRGTTRTALEADIGSKNSLQVLSLVAHESNCVGHYISH